MKLTVEDKKALVDWQESAGLRTEDFQELGMDSRGCNVCLVLCLDEDNNKHGFLYRYSSEEHFYDEDPMETFPVVGVETTTIIWVRADGEDWEL